MQKKKNHATNYIKNKIKSYINGSISISFILLVKMMNGIQLAAGNLTLREQLIKTHDFTKWNLRSVFVFVAGIRIGLGKRNRGWRRRPTNASVYIRFILFSR